MNFRTQIFNELGQDGRDTTSLLPYWDGVGSAWLNDSKTKTSWSPFFPEIGEGYTDRFSEFWDLDSAKWDLRREEQNSFDSDGNLLLAIDWSYFGGSTLGFRQKANYNANDQITYRMQENWDNVNQGWDSIWQWVWTYQGSGIMDYDTTMETRWVDNATFTGWSNVRRSAYLKRGNDSLEFIQEEGLNHIDWQLSTRIISTDDPMSGLMNINLLDINGRSIHSFPPAFIGLGSQRVDLDLSDVSSGIYFLRMRMGDQRFSRKLIKL